MILRHLVRPTKRFAYVGGRRLFNTSALLNLKHLSSLPLAFRFPQFQQRQYLSVSTISDQKDHPTKYSELLSTLLTINQDRKVNFGIDNSRLLLEAAGSEFYANGDYPIIHVAGTNGKGSVCIKLARSLESLGLTVGLFSSPHISSFRERMSVNGEYITETQIMELLPHLLSRAEQNNIPATFFELTTMMALGYFKKMNCDVVVLEVGLGGRLDSTNIVKPTYSVITSIGLDHVRVLGDTIEAIAKEKCGIIKDNTPVFIGPNVPIDVVQSVADSRDAPVTQISQTENYLDPSLSLANFDRENSLMAETVLRAMFADTQSPFIQALNNRRDAINNGKNCINYHTENDNNTDRIDLNDMDSLVSRAQELLDKGEMNGLLARPPCRFQQFSVDVTPNGVISSTASSSSSSPTSSSLMGCVHSTQVLLDVGHNPDAFAKLLPMIDAAYPSFDLRVVMGVSSDKDVNASMKLLRNGTKTLTHFYAIQANAPRATDAGIIADAARQELSIDTQVHLVDGGDVASGVRRAINDATSYNKNNANHRSNNNNYDNNNLNNTHENNNHSSTTKDDEKENNWQIQQPALILICGSFFIMKDARQTLNIHQPLDPYDLNETWGAVVRGRDGDDNGNDDNDNSINNNDGDGSINSSGNVNNSDVSHFSDTARHHRGTDKQTTTSFFCTNSNNRRTQADDLPDNKDSHTTDMNYRQNYRMKNNYNDTTIDRKRWLKKRHTKHVNARRKVVISGLNPKTSWQDLKDHMKKVGWIVEASLYLPGDGQDSHNTDGNDNHDTDDKDYNDNRKRASWSHVEEEDGRFGIAEFRTPKAALRAIQALDSTELGGRRITVRAYDADQHQNSRIIGDHDFKLFVKNMNNRTKWQALKDHFKEMGNIIRADVYYEYFEDDDDDNNDNHDDNQNSYYNNSDQTPEWDRNRKKYGIVKFQTEKMALRALKMMDGTELMGNAISVANFDPSKNKKTRDRYDHHYNTTTPTTTTNNNHHHHNHNSNNNSNNNTNGDAETRIFIGNLPYGTRWQELKDIFSQCGVVLYSDVFSNGGSGGVEFATHSDAVKAIETMNGTLYKERPLIVKWFEKI